MPHSQPRGQKGPDEEEGHWPSYIRIPVLLGKRSEFPWVQEHLPHLLGMSLSPEHTESLCLANRHVGFMSAQTVYQPAEASDSDGKCMKKQRATATIFQEQLESSSYVCPESTQERNSGPHRPEQQRGGQAMALQQGRPKTAIVFTGIVMQSGFKEINKCTTGTRTLGLLLPKSRFLAQSQAGSSSPSYSRSSPEQFSNV